MLPMNKSKSNIPILYYHSVADHERDNEWSFLSISIKLFETQMRYLHKKGYSSCDWEELYAHINGEKQLPEKTIMFHFDDGFLDNWSVVFPIMKKYGFKYSIVVTPEFIQKGENIRTFVKETKEKNKENWWGYLNEKEIKQMSDSGLVDFQAHGYSHTWYECSANLIDIYDGNNFFPHLIWNNNNEKKPYWLTSKQNVSIGYPVFEFKKSLELKKRFIPSLKIIEKLTAAYNPELSKEENLKYYKELLNDYNEKEIGHYEDEIETEKRFERELLATREYISKITGKPTDYLVFPGGGLTSDTIQMCKKYGYKLISKGEDGNLFNSNVYQVDRYSGAFNFPIFKIRLNVFFLKLQLLRAKGNPIIARLFTLLRK